VSVYAVRVGQIWLDCDKRMQNRKLQVDRIEGDHAVCRHWSEFGGASGRETRIRIDRFKKTSTGFLLFKDAPP
jgi:hypothetical protein